MAQWAHSVRSTAWNMISLLPMTYVCVQTLHLKKVYKFISIQLSSGKHTKTPLFYYFLFYHSLLQIRIHIVHSRCFFYMPCPRGISGKLVAVLNKVIRESFSRMADVNYHVMFSPVSIQTCCVRWETCAIRSSSRAWRDQCPLRSLSLQHG